ncbi:uncharacterized protein [Coffea arabica]|uniref:Endonuclease/exonuclease/phosphatase domain-containing protein n=1 Tax=Coffea arabica TaxID=13443 RepID=A0ABM4W321_COFAR
MVWNCQGVGSPLTIPQLRKACNLLSPQMVFLCETKNRKQFMEKIRRQLRFDKGVVVASMNKAVGMTVMWSSEVKVLEVRTTAFIMEVHIMDTDNNEDWWFIGIYASTDDQIRREQWEVIERRKVLWGTRWMITGDFNDITSNEEKWGGRKREEETFKDFGNFIEQNGLIDIGFKGNPWTWSNHWSQEGEIKQRLDRALVSNDWSQSFDKATVKHIDNFGSDHSMLLIDSIPLKERRKKHFFFDKRWLKKEGVEQVIKKA